MTDANQAPLPERGKPGISALLSLLCFGMGHVYLELWRRALALAAIYLGVAAVVAWLITLPSGSALTLLFGIALVPVLIVLGAVDAARQARHTQLRRSWSGPRRLLFCLLFLAGFGSLALGEAYIVRQTWAQAFREPTGSMQPTLLAGDYFYVNKRVYRSRAPRRGELVAFVYPVDRRVQYVKRLVGMPGDSLELRQNVLYVNGERVTSDVVPNGANSGLPVDEPTRRERLGGTEYLVLEAARNKMTDLPPQRIPAGCYLVLGDNRNNSFDSRFWGYVPDSLLVGRPTHIYWSYDADAMRVRWSRIGKRF